MRILTRFFPAVLFLFFLQISAQNQLLSPDKFWDFTPGDDQQLITYEELIKYLQMLDAESERIELREIGTTSLGKPMYICFISSAENIKNLDKLKEINRRLAKDPLIPHEEKQLIIEDGKVFFLATLSMHSTEVAPSQSAPLIAYDLATTTDVLKLDWLNDVVYMMVPCHNPDGMDMVVEHYKKHKNTNLEGSSLPRVYHKYVGHNINRDFVTLSQPENKAIAGIYNLEWFPQVMVEKHQMGSRGPRYYVPPAHDPIAENIDEGIWNWSGLFGMNMINDMTKDGLEGISQHYAFDDYWPGSTETCIWKNVIGFLTEAASVQMAKPVYVEPTELSVGGKGLAEYKKSVNMPLPWKGGWWHLRNIVNYEISSTMAILKTCSNHRKDILAFRNDLCIKEVAKGKNEPPYYYVMPKIQHDQSEMVDIVNLMKEHGIDVYELNHDVLINERLYKSGDVVIPLAQAFRPFIKEVMEKQNFPLRHYTTDGEAIKPYDITSWSLPLHRSVSSIEIKTRSKELESSISPIEGVYKILIKNSGKNKYVIFPANNNESYKAAFISLSEEHKVKRITEEIKLDDIIVPEGSFLIEQNDISEFVNELSVSPLYVNNTEGWEIKDVVMPRIGLVETIFHDMDAGWTRFIFDTYKIPYKVVKPGEFKDTEFKNDFDIVIFPDSDKDLLMTGKNKSDDGYSMTSYPPNLTKGIGEEGLQKVYEFVEGGGIIIAWGRSTLLFEGIQKIKQGKESEDFELPFNDISKKLSKKGLYLAGTLVRMKLINDHPLTLGMNDKVGIFSRGRPAFKTSIPYFDMDRRVIGIIPENDILMSGYAEKAEELGNTAGLIWLRKGKGQFVFFSFNPQFRASTQGCYKLLFNSLLLERVN